MNAEQYLTRLAVLQAHIEALNTDIEWDGVDERLDAWDQLEHLHADLGVLIREHSVALAEQLPPEYLHPRAGMVHTETERNVAWDGNGVLQALSQRVANVDGELIDAVPTATLERVLPAVKEGARSSKWNVTGLIASGVDPDEYRATSYGAKLVKRGPRWTKQSSRRPSRHSIDDAPAEVPAEETPPDPAALGLSIRPLSPDGS